MPCGANMPDVVFYREAPGRVPLHDWFEQLPQHARVKCLEAMERLGAEGHRLGRPHADLLRDGIRELRVQDRGVQYRLLYFFHDSQVVVSHGIVKKQSAVPDIEIERALTRKRRFETDPDRYSHEGASS